MSETTDNTNEPAEDRLDAESQDDPKSKKKTRLVFVLTLLINIGIVTYIAINEFRKDAENVRRIPLSSLQFGFLFVGIACFFVALFVDYRKYHHMLITSEGRCDKDAAFECSVLGKYYDNITPFGAGGQPFQMLSLRRHKVSTGGIASLPITGFLTQQIAFVLIALVVLILNPHVMDESPLIRIAAYVGVVMYALLPVLIILFAIFPKKLKRISIAIVMFFGKIHLFKKPKRKAASFMSMLDEYTSALRGMSKRPHFMFRLLFLSLIYQMAILSIPFFALRAFGGTLSWWTVFSMTVFIYSAITIIPTPGNSGAAEGSFYAVFSSLSGGYLFWAMMFWRIMVYYSWLAAGIARIAHNATRKPPKPKKKVPKDRYPDIAVFNDLFYPAVDGVVRTVDAYGQCMSKKAKNFCVVVPRESHYRDSESYKVIRTPSFHVKFSPYPVPFPFLGKEGREYFKTHKVDVIHTHSPFMTSKVALRLGKKFNVPVIATFHSKYYDDVIHYTHSRFLANLMKNHIVDLYSRMDAVYSCSRATAETLKSYGFNGPIGVLENGTWPYPDEDEAALREETYQTYKIPRDKRVLLFVGQQIWHKNLRLVLDTLKILKDRGENVCAVIAGVGVDGRKIRHHAKHIGIMNDVMFLGKVEDPKAVHGLYLCADLFFFPSLYDNAPLVVREAALASLPSLLVEGSNAAEPVTDGVNGYTEKNDSKAMADKIIHIFSDDEGRKAVGVKARETIPIPWETVVDGVIEEYRKA